MHTPAQEVLLDALRSCLGSEPRSTITENTDWRGQPYVSHTVILEQSHRVGFEVLEQEIIVFYFTDHVHFEDYTCPPEEGQPNYVDRAKAFLTDLFTLPLRHRATYRGGVLTREQYLLVRPDGSEDSPAGIICHRLLRGLNPFLRRRVDTVTWQYDKGKGCFSNHAPWHPDPEAVEWFAWGDGCYVEVFFRHGAYSYAVTELFYDDYYGTYFWAPAGNVLASGLYDSPETARQAAEEALRCCRNRSC